MNQQPTRTADERWAVATLRRSMVGVEPDVEALLGGIVLEDGRRRRRVAFALVAAAVLALLVGLGAVGLSTTGAAGDRLAEPAAPPTSLSDPVPGPSGSMIDARTAALYLTRLTGGLPTDQYGYDDMTDQVSAHLSFDGHTSRLEMSGDGSGTAEPTSVEAADVSVQLDTAGLGTTPDPDSAFGCGAWLSSCRTSVPGPGQALTTGTGLTANDCCYIRSERVAVAIYQRADGVVVTAEGRPDMFSTADVTRIATSPLWDTSVPPSPQDREAADALTPWAAG